MASKVIGEFKFICRYVFLENWPLHVTGIQKGSSIKQ